VSIISEVLKEEIDRNARRISVLQAYPGNENEIKSIERESEILRRTVRELEEAERAVAE
jgi:hypothetical protein